MQINVRSILTSTIFLKSIFVASLFILIFISSVTYKNTLALTNSSEALVKSHKTNRVLEQIMSYLKDAETGQRGFLITKDSIFLEPYIGSRQNIDLNLKTLKYLTTNTIQQQRNLKSLKMLINIRYDLFDKLLINYDGKAVNPNQFSKFMLNDKSVMDTIRDKINKMIELENIYLNSQKNELDTNISITPILTLLLFMFPLGVFVISYILINKNLLNLKEANKELIINSESMKHAQQIGEFSTSQWDIETHQINYSDNFFSLLGYKPQSFKPTMKTFLKFVHPADRDSVFTLEVPIAVASMAKEVVLFDLSWRAWRSVDCIDSTVLVIDLRPLSAASMVLIPEDMESSRLPMSPARLFSDEAVKKLDGLSRAEFTLRPVARRFCVLAILAAVDWSERRFWRTALERLTSAILDTLSRFLR